MTEAILPARVHEFFTLQQAEREASALPEAARASLSHSLVLAFQKREAAETLWPRGCSAEALALAKNALDRASAALDSLASADEGAAKPSWLVGARAVVEDARARVATAKLPELEAQTRPADEETFRVIITALLELERRSALGLASLQTIAGLRRGRWVATGVAAVCFIAAIAFWLHMPLVLHATASNQLAGYLPDNAVDGDTKTAWILPDKQPGWIDVTMGGKRHVKSLRIVPGNPPWNDRNVKEAHIEAFADGQSVKTLDFTFREPVGAAADWTELPFDVKCDRIRITAQSTYKVSPAIAEIEIR